MCTHGPTYYRTHRQLRGETDAAQHVAKPLRELRSLARCDDAAEPASELPGSQGETRAGRHLLPWSSRTCPNRHYCSQLVCTLRIEEEPICTQVGYQRTEGEEATEVPPESNSSRRAVSSSDLRDAWQDFRGSGSHPGHAGLQDVNGSRAGENRHEVGSSGYFGEGQCARSKINDCVGAKSTG